MGDDGYRVADQPLQRDLGGSFMANLGGSASADIEAPLEQVWQIIRTSAVLPSGRAASTALSWTQEKGDMNSVVGSWQLTDLGDGRTRADYTLDIDPGRMLGLVIRGPVEAATRAIFVNGRPGELKRRAEAG
ncbi:MAG TPA: SRPBCC family protein [Solirubrobacteraceae bacterium]|nr:SRPBCC family protein [Solirubrobacteraceae bacterium]